jgi:hypothetical protein
MGPLLEIGFPERVIQFGPFAGQQRVAGRLAAFQLAEAFLIFGPAPLSRSLVGLRAPVAEVARAVFRRGRRRECPGQSKARGDESGNGETAEDHGAASIDLGVRHVTLLCGRRSLE